MEKSFLLIGKKKKNHLKTESVRTQTANKIQSDGTSVLLLVCILLKIGGRSAGLNVTKFHRTTFTLTSIGKVAGLRIIRLIKQADATTYRFPGVFTVNHLPEYRY